MNIMYGDAEQKASYTSYSPLAFKLYETMIPYVTDIIGEVRYDGRGPFTVCDYGCADGGTSVHLMGAIIETVRQRFGSDTEILIKYNDQPGNDFNSLFLLLNGQSKNFPSYLPKYSDVFVSGVGTSFYQQSVPSRSIHLGISSLAAHNLQARPCRVAKALSVLSAEASKDEVDAFATQAANDWQRNLLHRSKEIAPGGYLVFCIPSRCQGDGQSTYAAYLHNIHLVWGEMKHQDIITEEEYQEATLYQYLRTESEVVAPFKDPKSPVFKSGLRLLSATSKHVPCPERQHWESELAKGNISAKDELVRSLVRSARWSYSIFMLSLSDQRPEDEKHEIVEEVFRRYGLFLSASPEDRGRGMHATFLRIYKPLSDITPHDAGIEANGTCQ